MPANTYPGRNMYIGLGIQNGMAATSASGATVYTYMQPVDVSGVIEEYTAIPSGRRLNSRFHGAGYAGVKSVPLGFTVECNPGTAGRLLKCILGAESVTVLVTAAVATHTFYPTEDLPYFTAVVYSASIAENSTTDKAHEILNCKINRATITGGIDDVMQIAVEAIGTTRSAITAPTASFTTAGPFFLNNADSIGILYTGATIGSIAAFEQARRVSIAISNGITLDHRIHGSSTANSVSEGDSEISGSFDCVYNGLTFAEINQFAANDDRAFRLLVTEVATIVTAQAYTLQIDIQNARYTGSPTSFDPDIITTQLPWIAELKSAQAFSITLKTPDVVAYTYSV